MKRNKFTTIFILVVLPLVMTLVLFAIIYQFTAHQIFLRNIILFSLLEIAVLSLFFGSVLRIMAKKNQNDKLAIESVAPLAIYIILLLVAISSIWRLTEQIEYAMLQVVFGFAGLFLAYGLTFEKIQSERKLQGEHPIISSTTIRWESNLNPRYYSFIKKVSFLYGLFPVAIWGIVFFLLFSDGVTFKELIAGPPSIFFYIAIILAIFVIRVARRTLSGKDKRYIINERGLFILREGFQNEFFSWQDFDNFRMSDVPVHTQPLAIVPVSKMTSGTHHIVFIIFNFVNHLFYRFLIKKSADIFNANQTGRVGNFLIFRLTDEARLVKSYDTMEGFVEIEIPDYLSEKIMRFVDSKVIGDKGG